MIIQHRRGETGEWRKADSLANQLPDVILKDGEFAIEELADGSRRIRIGDGSSKFFDLPYVDTDTEALVDRLVASAITELQKNITAVDSKQSANIENIKKLLLDSVARQAAAMTDKYTAADAAIVSKIDDKISSINTLQDKLFEDSAAKNTAISNLSIKLANTEGKLTNHVASTTNQLQKINVDINSLSNSINSSTEELNAKLDLQKTEASEALDSTADRLTKNFTADVTRVKTELEKSITNNATTQANNLQTTRANLENQLATDRAEQTKSLNDLKIALEAAVASLASTITKVDQRDGAAIADILIELNSLKLSIQQLDKTDGLLLDQIYAVYNALTNITKQLSDRLAALATSHETAVTTLSSNLEDLKQTQSITDAAIVNKMLEYVSDIYAELADLVDDDILILEKVFSTENALTSRINTIEADLYATAARIDELSPESLADVKHTLNESITANADKISELSTIIGATGANLIGITTSDISSNSTANPIIVSDLEHTAVVGDIVVYDEKEFIWTGELWQALGTISRSGKLETWRMGLNTDDASIENQFITAVSQADGKISVVRAQPTAADIDYNGDCLDTILSNRAERFSALSAICLKFKEDDSKLYIGDDADNSIIFYCGTATDI